MDAALVVRAVEADLVSRGVPRGRAVGLVRRAVYKISRRPPAGISVPPGLLRSSKAPLYGTSMTLGQGAEVFFGKSQSYYTYLDRVQNRVIGIQAEMAEIGEDNWDNALWSNMSEVANAGWMPVENYLFSPMMAWWKENYKKLLRTPSVEPTEATIQEVERLAGGTDKLIAFVKSLLPREIANAATAYREEAIAKVASYGMTSPGDVARQTVVDEIQKKVGGWTTNLLLIGGVIAAAAAGAYAFFSRRKG